MNMDTLDFAIRIREYRINAIRRRKESFKIPFKRKQSNIKPEHQRATINKQNRKARFNYIKAKRRSSILP